MITKRDDLRHLPSPESNFSESKWFSFYDGSQGFWVSARIGLESNRGKANRWLVVAHRGEVVFHDLAVNRPLPAADWSDITVAGLRICTLQPMLCYGIAYSDATLQFEIDWQAITPVFDYQECVAPLPPSLAAEHYEQSGSVRGFFSHAGQRYEIRGSGHRDHSWGVRHWEGFREWIAFMAPFGEGDFLHLEQFDEESTGLTRHGFIYSQGKNTPLRDAKIELEFDKKTRYQRGFQVWMKTVQGTEFVVTGEVHAICPLRIGRSTVVESFGTFRYQGHSSFGIIEYGYSEDNIPPP